MDEKKQKLIRRLLSTKSESEIDLWNSVTLLEEEIANLRNELKRDIPEDGRIERLAMKLAAKLASLEKGDKGDTGDVGPQGPQGEPGKDGKNGRDGRDGQNGNDGLDGRDGRDGIDGKDGKDGKDGIEITPNQVVAKVNEATDQIDASHIKNLPRSIERIIETQGGFIETAIKAGSNVTVRKDASGAWVISATGGSGTFSKLDATGTVDGSNTSFTFISAPVIIYVDGVAMQATSSDGTVNWTGTTSVTLSVAPTFDIFGI